MSGIVKKSMNNLRSFRTVAFLVIFLLLLYPVSTFADQGMMKGPATLRHESTGQKQLETSAVKLVLQAGIKLFQKRVSPIDGPRCGFHPTCSSFGLTAINRHGAVIGAIMTADRLIRCNPWKRVGGTYESLQNGKLSDPVGDNVFSK
jgi:putative membrane protein insertion efficiency factor